MRKISFNTAGSGTENGKTGQYVAAASAIVYRLRNNRLCRLTIEADIEQAET